MKLYALTGGIGSGKSTVAKFFDKAGIPVISADALNAEAARSPEIQKRIFDRFGTNDRMELRKIIFADMQSKKDMEAIMHPAVQDLFFKAFNDLADKDFAVAIYESALVFELGQRHTFEGVISVVCPDETRRMKRIVKRDNMNEEIAHNIMACQVDDEHRMTHSDYIIVNDCPLEELEKKTIQILAQIHQADSSPLAGDTPS